MDKMVCPFCGLIDDEDVWEREHINTDKDKKENEKYKCPKCKKGLTPQDFGDED